MLYLCGFVPYLRVWHWWVVACLVILLTIQQAPYSSRRASAWWRYLCHTDKFVCVRAFVSSLIQLPHSCGLLQVSNKNTCMFNSECCSTIAFLAVNFITSHVHAFCLRWSSDLKDTAVAFLAVNFFLPRMSMLSAWDGRKKWKVWISPLSTWILSLRTSVFYSLRWSWILQDTDIALLVLYFVTLHICAFCLRCPREPDNIDIITIEAVLCYFATVYFCYAIGVNIGCATFPQFCPRGSQHLGHSYGYQ